MVGASILSGQVLNEDHRLREAGPDHRDARQDCDLGRRQSRKTASTGSSRPSTSSRSRRRCASRKPRAARWCWWASGLTGVQSALRNGLAMGADSAVHLKDALFDAADTLGIARALAAAIKAIGGYDLVLAGQQGAGGDNGQVPGLLAELLDLPQVTMAGQAGSAGRPGDRRAGDRGRPGDLADQPARRAVGPEGPERAPLCEPEGHHGGEEEDDRREGRRGPGPGRRGSGPRTRVVSMELPRHGPPSR